MAGRATALVTVEWLAMTLSPVAGPSADTAAPLGATMAELPPAVMAGAVITGAVITAAATMAATDGVR
jgi:hypothetical protein